MSTVNRSVKPFIQAHDFYPGLKLEEACFAKAIIKDVDQRSRFRSKKSDIDQEPVTWPHEKSTKQSSYENFLEQVINEKTGEFYPQRDENGTAIKNSGATYFIKSIYRTRRADGSEYLYTKGIVYAFNSLGDPIRHSISMPELWTKVNFSYKTEFDPKTNQPERVLQGPNGSEQIYTMPFTKEALKSLFDRRENDLLGLAVKDEPTGKAVEVKDVTGNLSKSYELFRDQSFVNLITSNHIPAQVKAELRAAAVADGIISGTPSDYQPPSSSATTAKNTYQ